MVSMKKLTEKQATILRFITSELAEGRPCPTRREIAAEFGFASSFAAACHIQALIKKGVLIAEAGKSRALRLAEAFRPATTNPVFKIPVFGSIPAGFGEDRGEEAEGEGCVTVDIATVGFKPTRNTFALRVTGDSMIGRHICNGDIVILEHGAEPRHNQIVAALIDRKSTLKTFVVKSGKSFLKAENPRYPDLIPSEELMIQGVLRALIRKAKE